ncbi:mosc domain containing protein [Ophiostoma piceae UAMH 11346]|uniref:Mosc domain containing protein n=1 Tax=Ophiostoma piceae (strain UAMH 11346) TaxID=1262450 RepID=S3CF53_OPHP1|nr:mosc domain containing protein [Ophiostoma piceae UAMH 11346]
MKVTGIYVYPVKSLRGITLTDTLLGPQGVRYDRRFMLLSTKRSKEHKLQKMQLSEFPECALFSQELVLDSKDGDAVVIRYHPAPKSKGSSLAEGQGDNNRIVMASDEQPLLRIPLNPALDTLQPLDVDLHGSPANSYRMGGPYDAWFSTCFGFDVVLAYIGDGRREVLGESFKSKLAARPVLQPSSLLARLLAFLVAAWTACLAALGVSSAKKSEQTPWLTFTDCAPFLVASESSLRNVSARMSAGVDVPMYKFRPNIVVDGEGEEEWAEDFWGELTVATEKSVEDEARTPALSRSGSVSPSESSSQDSVRLLLTSNCARCTSLNVDYTTGAKAQGELGEVLKRLSKDRRVDQGVKYSPVFGRYAFLDCADDDGEVRIAVGDEVTVTQRNSERTTWDWPGL